MPHFSFNRALSSCLALTAATAAVVAGLPSLDRAAHASTPETRYVSTTGSDTNPGTLAAPFKTVRKGLTALAPGGTLLVRGGTYPERIIAPSIQAGLPEARTRVQAYPGERPVVQGLLWLTGASHWDISGLNVTWGAGGTSNEHMVKLTGGTGWTFTDAEVWGARSYAAILVAGPASGWTIARNYVHDTHASNGTNQDHLIYANSGSGGGTIERNVLARSSNGRAVKVGPPSATSGTVSNITIRYNTMVDNRGPSNVQLAWGTSRTLVERNIMVSPAEGRSAVTAYQLTGSGNVVKDNLAWAAPRVLDAGLAGMTDGGGNLIADPLFAAATVSDFRTLSALAAGYGRYAGTSASTAPVVSPSVSSTPVPVASAPAPTPTPTASPTTAPLATPAPTPAAPTPASAIVLRGSSTGRSATGTQLNAIKPSGVVAGDVLVASVDVRGGPAVTPPAGWTLVRADAADNTMRKATFVRVAGSNEPTSYLWTMSKANSAVVSVSAWSGVSTSSPVLVSNGSVNVSSRALVAPSVVGTSGARLVTFHGIATATGVTPPAGAAETTEVMAEATYSITGEMAQMSLTSLTPTGPLVANAARSAVSIGHALVLRPAAAQLS